MWCVSRTPNQAEPSQSQRDCVPQPKVDVLGYLGNLVPRLAPIPTGLRSTAQGCRTRLPWEPRAAISPIPTGLRPTAQGCRTRLPWEPRAAISPNPNGIAPHSPRLPYSATLGMATAMLPIPTGLRQRSASNVVEGGDGGAKPQPLRGWDTHRRFPQGSRVRLPWAEGRNLFEVGK